MHKADPPPGARERLLHVAAGMFAEYGFKATSIRKICERAGVNVASVNYYFQGKEELYLAVLDFARRQESADMAQAEELADSARSPQLRLRAAIRKTVSNLLNPGPSSLRTRLLAWELVEPSSAIATIAEKDIKPEHLFLAGLIREIAGETLDEDTIEKCVFSIIGQAVIYASGRRVHEIAAPHITYDAAGIDKIAEHIYRFSMAALAGLPRIDKEISR